MGALGMNSQRVLRTMEQEYLFDLNYFPTKEAQKKFRLIECPIWTKNKALFVARYMKTFTFVTKHGTYIDAFAGPQRENSKSKSWAVKLVLENEPAWLRNFYLFDIKKKQVKQLEKLKNDHFEKYPDLANTRKINIFLGDSNEALPKFLSENPVRDREATFCLLDQRTTECAWDTVKTIAAHKNRPGVNKIEIFYFLAQAWIDRSIQSWKIKPEERFLRWWGKEDIIDFLKLKSYERGIHLAERFKTELGYRHAYPFPIQDLGEKGKTMFWMIHASDHHRAPVLMHQAYKHIGAGGGLQEPPGQEELDFDREARETASLYF